MTLTDTALARFAAELATPRTKTPPVIDVGPVPGAPEEETISGYPPPAHLPAPCDTERVPVATGPTRAFLLDAALAIRVDPAPAAADHDLLQDLARDYCAAVDQLRDEYAHSDGLTHDLAQAEVRGDLARKVADTAMKELEAAHAQVAELTRLLRTERERVRHAQASHAGVVDQLAAGVCREHRLREHLERSEAERVQALKDQRAAEQLRIAAQEDAQQMRVCAGDSSQTARTLHGVVARLEAERHRLLGELRAARRPVPMAVPVFDLSDVVPDKEVVCFDEPTPTLPRTITPRQAVKTMRQEIGGVE
jgi:hypothetical protein